MRNAFVGKAEEVFSALSEEQSLQYDIVMNAVLLAYEMVPETCRQQFRNCRKESSKTNVEFARKNEPAFDRWCRSTAVERVLKI